MPPHRSRRGRGRRVAPRRRSAGGRRGEDAWSGSAPGASPIVCHRCARASLPPRPPPPLITALFRRLPGTTRLVHPSLLCGGFGSSPSCRRSSTGWTAPASRGAQSRFFSELGRHSVTGGKLVGAARCRARSLSAPAGSSTPPYNGAPALCRNDARHFGSRIETFQQLAAPFGSVLLPLRRQVGEGLPIRDRGDLRRRLAAILLGKGRAYRRHSGSRIGTFQHVTAPFGSARSAAEAEATAELAHDPDHRRPTRGMSPTSRRRMSAAPR